MKYRFLLIAFYGLYLSSQECHDFINSSSNILDKTFFSVGEIFVVEAKTTENENFKTTPLVFPNPTSGIFTLKLDDFTENHHIEIIDLTGRHIKSVRVEDTTIIDICDLSIGIYFLKSNLDKFAPFKIIKK